MSIGTTHAADNLIADPSFEKPKPKDRFGHVFAKWTGWIYEGTCEFRVSDVARTGKHSLLMVGADNPKIRAWPGNLLLEPGRYRVTAYLRGLDIGTGPYGQTTEFMFAGKYLPLRKNGTFGWTRLTYVGEVKDKRESSHPSLGLMAPGYLWVDDVSVEKVGDDVPLTPQPVLGTKERAIEPPGDAGPEPVRCSECGYRNRLSWGHCFACGRRLTAKKGAANGPAVKLITSFEDRNPFSGGTVVSEHATHGKKALRIDRGYVALDAEQKWTGYDYLKADVYTDAKAPLELYVEIRDKQTRDYWTRVNYTTVIPPGSSTLILPTALYVGEKSRPGRPLQLDGITRLVFSVGDKPEAPLFLDNLRLERDTATAAVLFDGLWAFDVGPAGSPLMEGFTPLDQGKTYSKGRGYSWKNARFWRGFDALQPDPLYRDFLCVEKGGLAIDVPNGKYHLFVNMIPSRNATSATGTTTTCPPTIPSTRIRYRTSRRSIASSRCATASSTSTSRVRTGPAACPRSSFIPTPRPTRASVFSTSFGSAAASTSITSSSASCRVRPAPTRSRRSRTRRAGSSPSCATG